MSVVNVMACADTAGRVDYLIAGTGEMKLTHRILGTNRIAAMSCDAENIEAFIREAQAQADAHGRSVQSLAYFQSFDLSVFDPNNPEDVQAVNDAGYALGDRMHPNSTKAVITHTDGKGGDGCGSKPHNHIVVINHDNETGKALRQYRRHAEVVKINDKLMTDLGLETATQIVARKERERMQREGVDTQFKAVTRKDFWDRRREHVGEGERSFDDQLGQKCIEAMLEIEADPSNATWEQYVANLSARGVEVKVDERQIKRGGQQQTVQGVTYRMYDETGSKPRYRRRKASKLSEDLTKNGVESWLEDIRQQHIELAKEKSNAISTNAIEFESIDELDIELSEQQQWNERLERAEWSNREGDQRADRRTEQDRSVGQGTDQSFGEARDVRQVESTASERLAQRVDELKRQAEEREQSQREASASDRKSDERSGKVDVVLSERERQRKRDIDQLKRRRAAEEDRGLGY